MIAQTILNTTHRHRDAINQTLTVFYFFALMFLCIFGVLHWLISGSWYAVFPLGIPNNFFNIPARPFSLFMFASFGVLLYFRYKENAFHSILMLGFTYCGWELIQNVFDPIVRVWTGNQFYGPTPSIIGIWLVIMFFAWTFVNPKININNWATIALFLYYANGDYLLEQFGGRYEGTYTDAIYSIGTIIVWTIFILHSMRPTRS